MRATALAVMASESQTRYQAAHELQGCVRTQGLGSIEGCRAGSLSGHHSWNASLRCLYDEAHQGENPQDVQDNVQEFDRPIEVVRERLIVAVGSYG